MLHLISSLNLFGNMPQAVETTPQTVDCVAEAFSGLAYTIEYTSPRFLLALVGAIVLVGGVWHADRSWDEKGSAAYKEAIDAWFPFPWAFLLVWALYAAAYWFPADS